MHIELKLSPEIRSVFSFRGNRDQQLIIAGSILAVICVALCINLAILFVKRGKSCLEGSEIIVDIDDGTHFAAASNQNEQSANNGTSGTTSKRNEHEFK